MAPTISVAQGTQSTSRHPLALRSRNPTGAAVAQQPAWRNGPAMPRQRGVTLAVAAVLR
jgi:hypothetical protein